MNAPLDTTLTVAGFVLAAVVVATMVPWGLFYFSLEIGKEPTQRSRRENVLRFIAVVVAPFLLIAPCIAAVVLANLTSEPTFYYPLIALAVGVAAHSGLVVSMAARVRRMRVGVPKAQDASVCINAAHAISEVTRYIHQQGIDYPTTGLAADRFEVGWSVYAPGRRAAGDPVFLIGDSGRIEQTSSTTRPLAQQRFTDQERGGSGHAP